MIGTGTTLDLLAARHAKDVFVAECKGGPTWGTTHLRLDAWAMRRSWANPCMFGYEVKHSRGDWLADQKLQAYLPMCNVLYVVAGVRGIVAPEELPEGVGLLEVASTGTMLRTLRKAPHRQVPFPEELAMYVLMSRCQITSSWYASAPKTYEERLAYWRRYLDEKREGAALAHEVNGRIRKLYRAVQEENERLHAEQAKVAVTVEALREVGLDVAKPGTWDVRYKAQQLAKDPAMEAVDRLLASLQAFKDQVQQAAAGAPA